ncbi:hypothetical protein B2H94_02610 [Clostridium sporogenes]|uniref:Uncharacterized protein n=2 Tax=Clostridium sporogenes TaxID=1509 RepID=A0ABD6S1Q9_CLOSG|nr:hypothetical protein [Clostridium sporogenes]EDU38738.1 hypothetical protein CLOSPO_01600 [Clostridium sporogenes ATCC 15579]OSB18028.1 hypothetical protein B2H94_02610 [Clostridium sporogenes]
MKKINTFFMSLCFILFFSTAVAAAGTVLDEVEPNNSPEQAQMMEKNNVNPSGVVKGDYTGQFVAAGKISDKSDEDWYKVLLSENNSTLLTVYSAQLNDTGIFDIYDENMNRIKSINHHQDVMVFGESAYKVVIPKTGNYYIKVTSPLRSGEYRFSIGGPNYKRGDYTYKAKNSCTLTPNKKSVQATYDLSSISSIPNEAIVHYISISGRKENRATSEYRSIKLESDRNWTSTAMYNYYADIPVISKKILKNKWMFKLEGNVSKYTEYYSLTPEITFKYIYPVLPK